MSSKSRSPNKFRNKYGRIMESGSQSRPSFQNPNQSGRGRRFGNQPGGGANNFNNQLGGGANNFNNQSGGGVNNFNNQSGSGANNRSRSRGRGHKKKVQSGRGSGGPLISRSHLQPLSGPSPGSPVIFKPYHNILSPAQPNNSDRVMRTYVNDCIGAHGRYEIEKTNEIPPVHNASSMDSAGDEEGEKNERKITYSSYKDLEMIDGGILPHSGEATQEKQPLLDKTIDLSESFESASSPKAPNPFLIPRYTFREEPEKFDKNDEKIAQNEPKFIFSQSNDDKNEKNESFSETKFGLSFTRDTPGKVDRNFTNFDTHFMDFSNSVQQFEAKKSLEFSGKVERNVSAFAKENEGQVSREAGNFIMSEDEEKCDKKENSEKKSPRKCRKSLKRKSICKNKSIEVINLEDEENSSDVMILSPFDNISSDEEVANYTLEDGEVVESDVDEDEVKVLAVVPSPPKSFQRRKTSGKLERRKSFMAQKRKSVLFELKRKSVEWAKNISASPAGKRRRLSGGGAGKNLFVTRSRPTTTLKKSLKRLQKHSPIKFPSSSQSSPTRLSNKARKALKINPLYAPLPPKNKGNTFRYFARHNKLKEANSREVGRNNREVGRNNRDNENSGSVSRRVLGKPRPVIIDASNVAIGHGNNKFFSCRGLALCIETVKSKLRHSEIICFAPRSVTKKYNSKDPHLLTQLEEEGILKYTPSREVKGKIYTSYDDRFILEYAYESGGIIISNDNYRDLFLEEPQWRSMIEKRLLQYTWVNDTFMLPSDPLGKFGPNLEEFCSFEIEGAPNSDFNQPSTST